MRRAGRPALLRRTALVFSAALLLAACGAGAKAGVPTWVPKPSFNGEGQLPSASAIVPGPTGPGGTPAPGSGPSSASPAPTTTNHDDPAIVATNLTAPDAIAILPDNTALVGERTTGRIVRVQPVPHQPVTTIRTLNGLDTSGGGGLLDLALSPNYAQDSLIFAYLTTPTDNRVVDFTMNGPVTPVLTGIPRGSSDNTGRLTFGDDGQLYIGTSDAGRPALAADPKSLAGKVLRVTDIGRPARGNPSASSPVFTSGHDVVAGLCLLAQSNVLLEVEPAATDGRAKVNQLTAGNSYGWPHRTAASTAPLATLPAAAAGPGGCAVLGANLYVTSLDGKSLLASALTVRSGVLTAGTFTTTLKDRYGRLRTVVAAADGALWMTTSNRDGHGTPVAADERVLRIVPSGGGSSTYPG